MPIDLITIPCLADNYAFLLIDRTTGNAALVDIPEAAPINAVLEREGASLTDILITHHHPDHIMGLDTLTGHESARIIGAKADAHRLPALDLEVSEGDPLTVLGQDTQIFDVSGHTIGHLAFYMPSLSALFTADSLMALGCGRLFEGTPAQMMDSLAKLTPLPGDTRVCSGHEYTATNARFALSIDPENAALQARAKATFAANETSTPTVPSTLADEIATNPFLRATDPSIAAHLEMQDASPLDIFTEIRTRRNNF